MPGKTAFLREVLEAEATRLNGVIGDLEAQRRDLQARLEQRIIADETVKEAMAWCELAREGIDQFTFEDKRRVIETLDVTGLVRRGETPDQTVIILSGFLPAMQIQGVAGNCTYHRVDTATCITNSNKGRLPSLLPFLSLSPPCC